MWMQRKSIETAASTQQLFFNSERKTCLLSLTADDRLSNDSDESRWLKWARLHADTLDPFRSGAVNRLIEKHHDTYMQEFN